MATQSPWHRTQVGGLWDEVGQLQLEFLVGRGLRPHHHLLDIGCGSLRAGVKLIAYLDSGHYHGIDKDAELLRCGRELELTVDLQRKAPTLLHTDEFELHLLGRRFDFAIAHSVFTHLPVNPIARCLTNVSGVLARSGVLYATFFENERGPRHLAPLEWQATDDVVITTYCDRDPYHYDLDTFKWLARRTGLRLDYLGDWGHPRGQRMLEFRPPRPWWFWASSNVRG